MKKGNVVWCVLTAAAASFGQSFFTTPLNDLGSGLYLNQFQGGLYELGTNTIPFDHAQLGLNAAAQIVPRDIKGKPSQSGRIGLIVMGMSNAGIEACNAPTIPCASESFLGQMAQSNVVSPAIVPVNCGLGGQSIEDWLDPSATPWSDCASAVNARRITKNQVQVVVLFQAHQLSNRTLYPSGPPPSLPAPNADAYRFERDLGTVIRTIKVKFPFVRQVYLETLTYEGYGCILSPEPYAFEDGFGAKWLIASQISQERGGGPDSQAGDLSGSVAPWIAWGWYQWASAGNVRSDGLTWLASDNRADNCHPSSQGVAKVISGPGGNNGWMNFFLTLPQSSWFRMRTP